MLNDVVKQMTGRNDLTAPLNLSQFITQAQTALLQGYDPILKAINQVLSRTIFSARAYNGMFPRFAVTRERWGNHIRKINYSQNDYEENSFIYNLQDGDTVDQWKIRKLPVRQTNFYGRNPYSYHDTTFLIQLDTAFSGPQEFMQFMTAKAVEINNFFTDGKDAQARAVIGNFIAAKNIVDGKNVIHLVEEYNKEKGTNLTTDTVRSPENWGDFVRWFYGYLETTSKAMENRSVNRHLNFTDFNFYRHTPKKYQKLYLSSYILNSMRAEVLSTTFNQQLLSFGDFTEVTYWQGEQSPFEINVKPSYTDNTGAVVKADTAVNLKHVFGILYDYEAMGIAYANDMVLTTPVNVTGKYYNTEWSYDRQWWNDLTENAIVFLLDDGTADANAGRAKVDVQPAPDPVHPSL